MSKALLATAMLLSLAACGSMGADTPKSSRTAASGKAVLPVAPPPPLLLDERIVCAADVKQCLDGTSVSRNPAQDCAFDACPGASKP